MRFSPAIAAMAFAAILPVAAHAADATAWDDIQSTKKFVACVVPAYQPYSWKDPGGEWKGFA
ncbi:MAG TPA: hypothetical protein VEC75_08090, partial [Stellaceae bacterium]|nr:hypothetical protein [Stellaceae bacterium]